MAVEIERKFLVMGDQWRSLGTGQRYRQGYLASDAGRAVRVRVVGDRAFLTIKGGGQDISRLEFEYPIPVAEAEVMLEHLCDRPLIDKTRYKIPIGEVVWEVDEFAGENAGLIVAEVELTHPDQPLELPDWVGAEVSHDARYFNAALAKHPYRLWGSPSGG